MGNPVVFLLQIAPGLSDFRIQPKPIQGVIFVLGLAAIIFLIVYLNKSKKVKNSPIFQTGTIDKAELGKLVVKGMGKIARKYGLDAVEQRTLARALNNAGIELSGLFDSIDSIDNGFSRMVSVQSREDDGEQTVANLFSIRNKVEYYFSASEDAAQGNKAVPRRYRRLKADIPISFYLVSVTESRQGIKKVKKLSLDNQKLSGNILDISVGGCSISTRNTVAAGARIKVEFKIGKAPATALAMILRVNNDSSGNVLHTRFLKVPERTLNAINALIYNYRDI